MARTETHTLNTQQDTTPLLQVQQVSKRFGGLLAVDEVSFSLSSHEVLGLLGDNGAGKSTLIKILSGVYRPDGGQILFNAALRHFSSPMEAHKQGIETIYQDLTLCENLPVPQNIFLGREPVRRRLGFFSEVDTRFMFNEAEKVLEQLEISIPDLSRPIRTLSGGQRQAVAIARAIYWKARIMIMDEPTAALGVPEQLKVLELIRTLRSRNIPVIFISHQLQDVFAVADRVLVMRRGRNVGERLVGSTSTSEIVSLMVGAEQKAQGYRDEKIALTAKIRTNHL